ncbi:polysaccharide deacetylase family protein [Diaminobutyricibacter tongyongensis]|uniref:Polysaccharide deacetylase family protein n=1 Tax=Leifsonia tongyongensis TaxID=1268043 RepID=A0A6L9Y1Y2_9MICO|nr:polysaccharide deacetylase family protein [Diaminobutyricibacter tongyongensis]NEN07278.1 polysaccharide deacetylase family protein [Diaminobutyricibacter tongyongensis]
MTTHERSAAHLGPIGAHERYDYLPIHDRIHAPWPGGKKLAVYVAIGLEEYDFGAGHTENLLAGVPAPDLVNASWRDYGNRVGAFRLLKRLESFGMPPTILLNTAVYDSAPELIDEARRLGAEFVGHGITNSDSLAGLTSDEERRYLAAVSDRILSEDGTAPLGWSSPWLTHTANTLDLLAETGYRYVLDLRLDDQPVWLNTTGSPLLAMPYGLELNDSTSMVGRHVSSAGFADMIIDEFDELLLAAQEQPLVMSIVVHSFISGAPFRLKQLSRALQHIAQRSEDVWFTQPRHIYDVVRSFADIQPDTVVDQQEVFTHGLTR